jgi:D-alanyl-lipoteichoic acid acyltransferase DltB (MBOAT superfamily)
MYFDSTIYAVFLAIVVLLYWRLPFRPQNYFLLGASYFFYGWWDWRFLLLMATSTVVDYQSSRWMSASTDERHRRLLLIVSVTLNFSFLGFFKYFNFFVDSFSHLAQVAGLGSIPPLAWKILLPPAISFYTFQEVAYIVDVYKRRLKPATSLVDYALFVSLFPHLIAGPIQRPSHLLPQTQQPRHWDPNSAFDGIMLILEGLFRKVVIADNCALIANAAFAGNFGGPNVVTLALGVYAFAWQIYGDFSGYSSIARGSAQLLGFHFMVNFRQPYLADSVQDFWRRWHISLSTWLRDYLYIPLGGNRKGRVRTYVNLMATMLLGGLWHGANWTFVVWGGIHGCALSLERLFTRQSEIARPRNAATVWMRRFIVFNVVCLSWVFFRAPSLHEALTQLSGVTHWEWRSVYAPALTFVGVFGTLLLCLDLRLEASMGEYLFAGRSFAFRIAAAVAACTVISLLGANQANAFIYFRF